MELLVMRETKDDMDVVTEDPNLVGVERQAIHCFYLNIDRINEK